MLSAYNVRTHFHVGGKIHHVALDFNAMRFGDAPRRSWRACLALVWAQCQLARVAGFIGVGRFLVLRERTTRSIKPPHKGPMDSYSRWR